MDSGDALPLLPLRYPWRQNGAVSHQVSYRLGFRRVEVKGNVFTVNGKAVLINGVNHHDYSPEGGRTVDLEVMRQDVLLMNTAGQC